MSLIDDVFRASLIDLFLSDYFLWLPVPFVPLIDGSVLDILGWTFVIQLTSLIIMITNFYKSLSSEMVKMVSYHLSLYLQT